MLVLRNSLPRDVGLDENNLDDLIGKAREPGALGKYLCCAKEVDSVVKNIHALDKEISILGKLNYDVSEVFITFEKEEHQQRVLNAMQMSLLCTRKRDDKFSFNGINLNICEAAEPSAVRWDDLEEGSIVRAVFYFLTCWTLFRILTLFSIVTIL